MEDSYEFYIAGVKFHEAHQVLHDLNVGDTLIIEPEPTNKYDPNAVKLLYGENKVMLGYVPKRFSSSVSADIEIGTDLTCEIVQVNRSAKPWEQIKVAIIETIPED